MYFITNAGQHCIRAGLCSLHVLPRAQLYLQGEDLSRRQAEAGGT